MMLCSRLFIGIYVLLLLISTIALSGGDLVKKPSAVSPRTTPSSSEVKAGGKGTASKEAQRYSSYQAHDHAHDHRDEEGAHDHDHDHDDEAYRRQVKRDIVHDEEEDGHDDHHDHDHKGHIHGQEGTAKSRVKNRFSILIWAEALFATAIVGAAPVVVLLFVPLGIGRNQEGQKPLLRVFLSFAAGGLLGDSLLHLLPHSIPSSHSHDHGGHEHGHNHAHSHSIEDLMVWLWTIAGMMTFLMLEKFVRAQTGGNHSHGHSHGPLAQTVSPRKKKTDETGRFEYKANSNIDGSPKRRKRSMKSKDVENDVGVEIPAVPEHQHPHIAAAGYLNLAADFSHNFTDGLAIGATFLRGGGWQTTLAMLLHEVPHEIGDFAILIQSGFTRREAMFTQFLTAVGAMIGTVIGLLMEGAGDSSSAWISPFTAGGFIYIACTSVMPELLEDCSLLQSIKEGLAMVTGVGLMVLIALNE
jgi:zinc transporter 7